MTTTPTSHDDFVDGNALAAPLAEVFTAEITAALTTCAGCGRQNRLAQLRVYVGGPGMVARCPGCGDVVARYARTPTSGYLDLRGVVALQISLPAAD